MKNFFQKNWLLIVIPLNLLAICAGVIWVFSNVKQTVQQGQTVDYANRAETAMEEKKYSEAFEYLQKAQQVDPKNTTYTLLQADAAFLYGDYTVAKKLYKQFTDLEFAEVHYADALTKLSNLQISGALTDLSSAKEHINENRPLKLEDIEAITHQVEQLMNEQNQPLQKAKIGKLLIEHNAPLEAQTILLQLTSEEPEYRDGHYLLGAAYFQNNQLDKSTTELNKALSIDPNFEPARNLLNQHP
ncbi:tetratricopeptide repeat protein [candidate division WWE3 bacterium]|nr:tetratricopeptide repeat protein [candidate division WWE3 bacterium]